MHILTRRVSPQVYAQTMSGGPDVGEIVGKMLLSSLEKAEERLDDGTALGCVGCCA